MGLYDYIKCLMPLPGPGGPDTPWQTKCTPDQYMTQYTIGEDGRLSWRPYEIQTVPKAERPYPHDDGILGMAGAWRRVEQDPVILDDYHGDIYFYHDIAGAWVEYRARFTNGVCTSITPVDEARGAPNPAPPAP